MFRPRREVWSRPKYKLKKMGLHYDLVKWSKIIDELLNIIIRCLYQIHHTLLTYTLFPGSSDTQDFRLAAKPDLSPKNHPWPIRTMSSRLHRVFFGELQSKAINPGSGRRWAPDDLITGWPHLPDYCEFKAAKQSTTTPILGNSHMAPSHSITPRRCLSPLNAMRTWNRRPLSRQNAIGRLPAPRFWGSFP